MSHIHESVFIVGRTIMHTRFSIHEDKSNENYVIRDSGELIKLKVYSKIYQEFFECYPTLLIRLNTSVSAAMNNEVFR